MQRIRTALTQPLLAVVALLGFAMMAGLSFSGSPGIAHARPCAIPASPAVIVTPYHGCDEPADDVHLFGGSSESADGQEVAGLSLLNRCSHLHAFSPSATSILYGGVTYCDLPVQVISHDGYLGYFMEEINQWFQVDLYFAPSCYNAADCPSSATVSGIPAPGMYEVLYCHSIFDGANGFVPRHCHGKSYFIS